MATTRLLSAMVATWNNVATTFTGLKLNVTDAASASGSLLVDLQVGGVSQFKVQKDGATTAGTYRSAGDFWANSNTARLVMGTSGDVILARDAANVLALRRGTAAQAFNVYNTYTDASNYERGVFDWTGTANTLRIGTEAAGTGTVRNIQLVAGSNTVTMTPGAANLLTLNGGLTASSTISGTNIEAGANSAVRFAGRGRFISPADGIIRATNAAETDFTRLILGTNDTSGVAIVKNGTGVEIKLGDSSAWTTLVASALYSNSFVKTQPTTVAGLTAAATAGAGARSFVTDATATTFMSTVAGGGANKVPVVSDGTNWLIG